jgi:hypothetical protein
MPHRKSQKRSRKSLKKAARKTRRGGYYGFNQGSPVGTGAASVTTGQEVKIPSYAAGRRRKSIRRRVKGGTRYETSSAGYVGTGSRGIADYIDVGSTRGTSAMGSFNNYGAQPGSGGASFVKVA